MKISKQRKKLQTADKISGNRKGVALVLVLTVMSLATIMIMTFFQLATSEHKASATYSRGLQAQQVAEQAVNMVVAQIRKATASTDVAWASQPGALRTWTSKGKFQMGYKLYSDNTLQETTESKLVEDDFKDAQTWTTRPNEFVDLNEPVIRGQKVYFPIVDPQARDKPEWPAAIGGETDKAGVEGFDFNFDAGHTLSPGELDKIIKEKNGVGHLALPVRWMYQLADGTMGYLEGNTFKSISGTITPTENNQIVARFAYWADDETAKLNLNVHAGGLAWDTPRAGGDMDMDMGKYQPVQHEWQRYPGHPATTHLVPALAPGVLDIVRNKSAMEMIFMTVPRIVGGGSESGTRKVNPLDKKERNGLIADKNPLFPSEDEYVMAPDRTPNYFPQANGMPSPEAETADMLERLRFFLTTTSRAPETTLFNTPRVVMWPISVNNDNKYRTPFDQLIDFCSTINKQEYIFKRKNSDSAKDDLYDPALKRNLTLYNYLAKLTSGDIPGVGASFEDKYPGADRYQILTEMFDYIRSTNLHDDSLFGEDWESAYKDKNSSTHVTYTNPRKQNPKLDVVGQSGIHKGHGQVTPIEVKEGGFTTKGFGRFYTLKEVAIQVICVADGGDGGIQGNYAEALGGLAVGPRNPGFRNYPNNNITDNDDTPQSSNFPPMHAGASVGDPTTYPDWLRDWLNSYLKGAAEWLPEPAGRGDWEERYQKRGEAGRAQYWQEVVTIIQPAFKPESWNWNLMFNRCNASNKAIPVDPSNNTQFIAPAKDHFMRVGPNEKLVQAAMIFNMFCPSMGWVPVNPDMSVEINMDHSFRFYSVGPGGAVKPRVGDLRAGQTKFYGDYFDASKGEQYGRFPVHYTVQGDLVAGSPAWTWYTNDRQTAWHHRHAGGSLPFTYIMGEDGRNRTQIGTLKNFGVDVANQETGTRTTGRLTPLDIEYEKAHEGNRYPFVTPPFRIGPAAQNAPPYPRAVAESYRLKMEGGKITFKIYSHGDKTNGTYGPGELSAPQSAPQLVQTIDVEMPYIEVHSPLLAAGRTGYINEFKGKESFPVAPMDMWSLGIRGSQPSSTGRLFRISSDNGQLFDDRDVIQSVGVHHGDVRLASVRANIGLSDDVFEPHFRYATPGNTSWSNDYGTDSSLAFSRIAHDMSMSTGYRYEGGDGRLTAAYAKGGNLDEVRSKQILPGLNFAGKLPPNSTGKLSGSEVCRYGDFDNGMGLLVDGPYINKPDEGNTHSLYQRTDGRDPNAWELRRDYGDFPYFVRDWLHEAGSPAYFSPNRIVSGPGMFGSMPTGALHDDQPWQTLLFRPQAGTGHPGAPGKTYDGKSIPGGKDPADHYFLDLFWMPVVEPYAISEPLSTAGKVNLNYQILPFRNVKRNTSMRGIFRSELMVLIPTMGYDPTKVKNNATGNWQRTGPSQYTTNYKHNSGRGANWHWRDKPNAGFLQGKRLRAVIQEPKTLEQFQERFDKGYIFKSASEVCEVHLVPQQVSERMGLDTARNRLDTYTPEVAQMESGKFWRDHAAVGDNSRERAYGNIYNRVTTKSNTFKVHYRGQVLKQGRRQDNDYTKWDPELDSVVGEYRGSSVVERYIDPNSTLIEDYAKIIGESSGPLASILKNVKSIGDHYQFRIVNPTRFAP